jgi:hypothetical protein
MKSEHAVVPPLAFLVAFASAAALGAGPIDHDRVAMRLIDHECCRVIVPPSTPAGATPSTAGCSDADGIDVLWCYTATALAVAGGDADQLFSACEFAVADANETFTNTGLPFPVRIVGFATTDYDEAGDHLALLQGTGDGVMDEIHALRDIAAGVEAGEAQVVVLRAGHVARPPITDTGKCFGFGYS